MLQALMLTNILKVIFHLSSVSARSGMAGNVSTTVLRKDHSTLLQ